MLGPTDPQWDLAAIMYFPTRTAFMEMLSDPKFQEASRHRKAAFASHCMLHVDWSVTLRNPMPAVGTFATVEALF